MAVTYRYVAAEAALALIDPMADLYAVVYVEPPYCEGPDDTRRFRESYVTDIARPGFALVVAEEMGKLVGVAYGYTMQIGAWWRSASTEPRPEILNAEKFAVMEWIVLPAHRGHGIGGQVLDRLMEARSEPWATLAANPDAPARSIYEHRGWRQVARSMLPNGAGMDLLVLKMASR